MALRECVSVADLSNMAFVTIRTNRDYAMRKHIQGICRRCGILGDGPGSLTLATAETYDELLLYGLGDQFLMLPESLAVRYTLSPGCGYVTRPLIGEGTDYDICAFYIANPPSSTAAVVRALREVASEAP